MLFTTYPPDVSTRFNTLLLRLGNRALQFSCWKWAPEAQRRWPRSPVWAWNNSCTDPREVAATRYRGPYPMFHDGAGNYFPAAAIEAGTS
jgi:hypothetical protein